MVRPFERTRGKRFGAAPSRRTSRYVTMRDGVRLAADVWLPGGAAPGSRLPTMLHQTRYFRGLELPAVPRLLGGARMLEPVGPLREGFLAAGYAWVDVDVRGTGASFGSWLSPWWHEEVADGGEVVDWIIRQPWSSGRVGSVGTSYAGTTAEFLGTLAHPAVKAIAPRFSLFDVFTDVASPGGLHLSWFTEQWERLNRLLDQNQHHGALALVSRVNCAAWRQLLTDRRQSPRLAAALGVLEGEGAQRGLAYLWRLISKGVRPAGGRGARAEMWRAIAEHAGNVDVHRGALAMRHRDDVGLYDVAPDANVDRFSPHTYVAKLRAAEVPVYGYSGWLDGAYQHAALKRHMNLASGRSHVIIGPWEHGGRQDISPFTKSSKPEFDHLQELLRFFDLHVKGVETDFVDQAPVRYYTLGAERWRESEVWPPAEVRTIPWHFASGLRLQRRPARSSGVDPYQVDRTAGTGLRSRWRSLLRISVPVGYGDRACADTRLLCYTSPPLPDDLEVTGHHVVRLHVEASVPDFALHVYLEDVGPPGGVTLVTEGQLRACHRKVSHASPPYAMAVPHHSFRREDAAPLPPGKVDELTFDLLPISYLFQRGHALRVAIAGADRDHFAAVTTEDHSIRLHRGGERQSLIELPVRIV
ncbi:MAG: CocE/NonD family hydrolase [Deltaproteobacteria bacterium]|nr:CocE/NonD family hydrolase [Deltaproteobacteria bacterium]MBW2533826.1 CocE/NonD family hydrolase [Deltaproteobacteria bacterium]